MTDIWTPPKKRLLATSVDELREKYTVLRPIEHDIRFKSYCGSCETLYLNGVAAWDEGDLEKAYIFLMKLCILWIEKLPSHPGYNDPVVAELKPKIKEYCLKSLDHLKIIKENLKEMYPKYLEWLEKRKQHLLHLRHLKAEQEQLDAENRKKMIAEDEQAARELQNQLRRQDQYLQAQHNGYSSSKKIRKKNVLDSNRNRDGVILLEEAGGTDSSSTDWSPIPLIPPDDETSWRESWSASQSQVDQHLRPMILNQGLIYHFLEIVYADTAREIESCGLLCGVEKYGKLYVTHLLLPKQKGTASTCKAIDEEAVTNYQLEHGLMTLGWIHTHPTQECFLSSVDLHMQLGYQRLLPEAIAIVCAPRTQPNLGIFRLSQPGLQHLKECNRGCDFHPHLESGIYQVADDVRLDPCDYKVIDLR